ncbi:MAG: T9SS type A sorting domain-containing protein [Salibacteraceae bacterium]|jgi:hypothetical protein|nr:T9SS type A sorting domain-containing protein [Salibacteraceae bacterium]MDP4686505.1 T9SS type A sorting domain-containing protein [Salibacteraceae bacterium]MDP4764304.1 T9SS type A sorting domain-containing protein [Salibacteraceae bacterium]MDP4934336.1 T9SS type A sorting domain-containing protein [Salibacteraceae bacterium]
MTKIYSLIAMLLLLATIGNAQHYSAQSNTDTFALQDDTLHFTFANTPQTAWSTATIKVFFRGPFDWTSYSFDLYSENNGLIGNNWANNGWCKNTFDSSNVYVINNDSLLDWNADNTLDFYATISQYWCQGCCNFNDIYLTIEYDYCAQFSTGGFASIELPEDKLCNIDANTTPIVSPAGGMLTGAGVSGLMINVGDLASGSYVYTYTFTDALGCETSNQATLTVRSALGFTDQWACGGDNKIIEGLNANAMYAWYADSALTNLLDTANSFTFPNIDGPKTVIANAVANRNKFYVTSIDTSDFWYEDHNNETGDDRNGIAVTTNHVFVTGDNNTMRVNHDLNPASMVSLTLTDGLFSDPASGKLYSFYDGMDLYTEYWDNYNLKYIVELDSNLTIIPGTEVELTEAMEFTDNYSWFLASGAGFVILWNDVHFNWVHIDLYSGLVTPLADDQNPNFYGGENWADWGIAMFDGTYFSVMYRSSNWPAEWKVKTFDSGTILSDTVFHQFDDLADNATITYSIALERFYVHAEGSGQLWGNGYSGEMVAWFAGTSVIENLGTVAVGCPTVINVYVNTIDLGMDTVLCANEYFDLVAGIGYQSYTWNGVNNNYNAIRVDSTGDYTILAIDEYGCEVKDTISVTLNDCLGVNEIDNASLIVYPNPTTDVVSLTTNMNGYKTAQVYDMTGRVVAVENTNTNTMTISLAALKAGVYKVVVTSEEGVQGVGVVKQ